MLVVDADPAAAARTRSLVATVAPEAVVRTASSSTLALLRCGSLRPDLVLLDASVPGLGAFEVAGAMSAVEELRAAVLVLVTGPEPSEPRAAAAGVAAVATRPLGRDDVATLVALVDDDDVVRVGDVDGTTGTINGHTGGAAT